MSSIQTNVWVAPGQRVTPNLSQNGILFYILSQCLQRLLGQFRLQITITTPATSIPLCLTNVPRYFLSVGLLPKCKYNSFRISSVQCLDFSSRQSQPSRPEYMTSVMVDGLLFMYVSLVCVLFLEPVCYFSSTAFALSPSPGCFYGYR